MSTQPKITLSDLQFVTYVGCWYNLPQFKKSLNRIAIYKDEEFYYLVPFNYGRGEPSTSSKYTKITKDEFFELPDHSGDWVRETNLFFSLCGIELPN